MRPGNARRIACALLVLYAIAFTHQIVPHSHGHSHGEGHDDCPLCLLLYTTGLVIAILLPVFAASRVVACLAGHPTALALAVNPWRSPPLRGPPILLHSPAIR